MSAQLILFDLLILISHGLVIDHIYWLGMRREPTRVTLSHSLVAATLLWSYFSYTEAGPFACEHFWTALVANHVLFFKSLGTLLFLELLFTLLDLPP